MNTKVLGMGLIGFVLVSAVLTACASPTQAPATPTPLVFPTEGVLLIPTETASALTQPPMDSTPVTASTAAPLTTDVCADPQSAALIDSFKKAILSRDGALLASLVSPTNGMDVKFYHSGNVINYDQQHAKFLFETTFEADWGPHPASGENKIGAFHDVVVPELEKSFNQPYSLYCNELKAPSGNYTASFPYDKDFYSIYYPGTEANGNMDWHTWVAGIEYVNGKPYLYALTQFFWEP